MPIRSGICVGAYIMSIIIYAFPAHFLLFFSLPLSKILLNFNGKMPLPLEYRTVGTLRNLIIYWCLGIASLILDCI